jgi:hypothetical protein
MVSPVLVLSFAAVGQGLLVGVHSNLAQNTPVEQHVLRNEHLPVCCRADRCDIVKAGVARSLAGDRFALAIRASPMLETAGIGGDAGSL